VLIVAALIGGTVQSWSLFLISAAVMILLLIHGGDIRPTPDSQRKKRQRR